MNWMIGFTGLEGHTPVFDKTEEVIKLNFAVKTKNFQMMDQKMYSTKKGSSLPQILKMKKREIFNRTKR